MRARRQVVTLTAITVLVLFAAVFRLAALDAAPGEAPPPPPPPAPAPAAVPAPAPAPAPAPSPPPPARPVIDTPGYWSWALLDRTTLEITAGPEPGTTSSTESMIKVWIVADALRGNPDPGARPPAELLDLASAAIRRSDDGAAETLYLAGGGDEVIRRLIDICGLTDTTAYPGWWSRTEMSARDAVRMGLCVANGRAAGPEWTEWVMAEMRQVEGTATAADQPHGGRWGIIDALPADQAARLAIKNGWTPVWADGAWHVSCLAIADDWILAVQARYPVDLGLDHGVAACRDLAQQVLAYPSPGQAG